MLPSELKLASLGHCYVHLPRAFVAKETSIKPGAVVSIRSVQDDTEIYALWNGHLVAENFAQMDLRFARANGLKDELIVISLVDYLEPTNCQSCRVELIEASDINILNNHSTINLLETCRLISLNMVVPIYVSQHVHVLVKVADMQPKCKEFALLTNETEMQYSHSLEAQNTPQNKRQPSADSSTARQPAAEAPIEQPTPFVSRCLGIDCKPTRISLGAMLVCGERGSGKTHHLESILARYRARCRGKLINCKQFRGKRPETIKKILGEALGEALQQQPYILALDDIESLVGSDPKREEERGPDTIYRHRLVDLFCQFLKGIERLGDSDSSTAASAAAAAAAEGSSAQPLASPPPMAGGHRARVAVLASCRDLESLHKRVSKPRGRQFFNHVHTIGAPSLAERVAILRGLLAEHSKQVSSEGLGECELEQVAKKCGNSFTPLDLRRLVERALLAACSRALQQFSAEQVTLTGAELDAALDNYVPANLRGVVAPPQARPGRTMAQVGGMEPIKRALKRTVLEPLRYPGLFRRLAALGSSVRPQTSVLLYGPPGCGKTLVAEALINESGLNSICVRGPELLSKYIGASEAAVRDLFRRAQLAKPCVLFFDEFESLVARRGADSTGVTDRIVNQFLTILDGVERLDGQVFIVASSSRPDMIDPAMLRPGRLDRHLYCGAPNLADRADILRVLGSRVRLAAEADVGGSPKLAIEWSRRLDKFTGADLRALLYAAQLRAVREECDRGAKTTPRLAPIGTVHLEGARADMAAEVAARYAQFASHYSPNSTRRPARAPPAARATLA